MNRKGFTLIELLAVIVIIGILGILIVPGILNNVNNAKDASYNTLIKNIVTSSQTYYEECEYGDLTDITKYGKYSCNTEEEKKEEYECFMDKANKTINTTLGALANTGFLNIKDIKENEDGSEIKIVKDPKTDNDISDCKIKITKVVEPSTYKVTYRVTNNDTKDICPSIYQ